MAQNSTVERTAMKAFQVRVVQAIWRSYVGFDRFVLLATFDHFDFQRLLITEDEEDKKDCHRDGGVKSQPPPTSARQQSEQQAVELEPGNTNTATERIASLSLLAGENGGTLL